MQHTASHTTAVQSPSHWQWYILTGKQRYQLPEFIPYKSVKTQHTEKQWESITDEKILAAKAAAVVRDVKNVALPAAVSVCHMRSCSDVIELDWRNVLMNTNTSSTPAQTPAVKYDTREPSVKVTPTTFSPSWCQPKGIIFFVPFSLTLPRGSHYIISFTLSVAWTTKSHPEKVGDTSCVTYQKFLLCISSQVKTKKIRHVLVLIWEQLQRPTMMTTTLDTTVQPLGRHITNNIR